MKLTSNLLLVFLSFVSFNFNDVSAMDLRPLSEIYKKPKFDTLSLKEKALVKECAEKLGVKNFNDFEIEYKPKVDNAFAEFNAQMTWYPNYEKSQVVVIFKKIVSNRFGEKKSEESICGWAGFNYDLVFLKP
jgi:hypothetical protein